MPTATGSRRPQYLEGLADVWQSGTRKQPAVLTGMALGSSRAGRPAGRLQALPPAISRACSSKASSACGDMSRLFRPGPSAMPQIGRELPFLLRRLSYMKNHDHAGADRRSNRGWEWQIDLRRRNPPRGSALEFPALVTLAAMAALTAVTADAAPETGAPRGSHRGDGAARPPASRSWRSCRSRARRSRSTTPTAGFCARRCRPAPRDARRRPASSPSSRGTRTTARTCMTTPRCRTCSASPGTASRCTAGRCPDMRPRTAACGCRLALPKNCSTRRGSGCA